MKMEMVEQEDGDGNLARKVPQGVGRTRIEQGYKSRVDDHGPRTLMFTDRQESFKEEIEAGAFHSGETAEVRVSRGIFAQLDGEKGKALKLGVGEINDGFKDDAGMARSRALQEAVSYRVRQAQFLHQQHQPQRTSVVCWERFLPQRQLRVLLVEDDDSTRHVVSALLHNCSYEVTSAANGLLAWELLMDQTNHVDLVMTEVVMPCLSGIGLLERIMSHEALKHIPVIMMSSHDSMGIVFKCLSKGAVDFLVKPVRKNELKNLWQHVWRRCHSSSGSGSQTQKVARPDGAADLNNSGSNDESDNSSSELNIGGGSDNGSGTQTIWTKRAVEVESSHQGTKCGLNADSLLHSPNQTKNGCVLGVEHHEGKVVDIALPLYEKVATSRVATAKPTCFHNIEKGQLESTHEMPGTAAASVRDSRRLEEGAGSGLDQGNAQRAIDLVSAVSNKEQDSNEEQLADSEDADDLLEKHASNSPSSKDKTLSDSSSPSRLELSFKRPRQVEENNREQEGRGGLRHSYSSAFSRYNTSGNHTPLPAGTLPANKHIPAVGCGSLVQESCIGGSCPSSIPFTPQMERVAFPDGGTDEATALPYIKGILHASSNQDNSLPPAFPSGKHGVAACSAKEEAMQITGPETQMHIPPSPGVIGAFGSSKEPRFSGRAYIPHWESSAPGAEMGEVKDCCVSYEHNQGHLYSHSNQNSQLHHHSHHHHHHHHIQHHYHHHHQNQLQQNPMTPQLEDQTVMNVGAGAPMCGSSNMVKGTEGNNGQSGSSNGYGSNGNGAVSLNGSATGSNNGSNGHSNGCQGVVALAGGGSGDSVQLGAGNGLTLTHGVLLGLDQGRFARREAALTKFRQKRKERCFEKKVRYQSRKRLAEQRPRVRGQFVRQSVHESTIGEPEYASSWALK